jgi:hypothetical protein
MICRLVSGGQTGVDRAALDTALELGIPCGGWCPRGRRAEDGTIPDHYPLTETSSTEYRQRTEWNVRDADGTLILTWGEPAGGTLLTVQVCRNRRKPHYIVDLAEADQQAAVGMVRDWIAASLPGGILNVAGPRASQDAAVVERAKAFLRAVLGSGA